jgi:group I intron endonuclease
MGYIYLITNKVSGKQYVGQTICKDVEKRWRQHKKCDGKTIGRYLQAAYNKYGIDNFKFQIICICFDEDCNKFEEDYIKKFNTLVPNGYNLREGGMNSKQHPESIKLRADKNRGKVYGPLSDSTKKKLSEGRLGNKNPNFGKIITKERKAKLSASMKKVWDERIKNNLPINSNFIKDCISPNRKRVGKFNEEGILLEVFDSTCEAGLKIGISHSTIAKVCRGVKYYKTAAGFLWKFLPDQMLTS